MVDKSIAYRLSFLISVAVILVFIAFIVAYFLFNRRLLRENIENKAIGLSSDVSSVINREVNLIKEVSANLAEQVVYYNQHGDIEKLLRPVVEKYPHLVSVDVYFDTWNSQLFHYYSVSKHDKLKVIKTDRTESLSPTEKEKFLIPDSIEIPGWAAPYKSLETGSAIASYYFPIFMNSENKQVSLGYVRSNLSLNDLNVSINKIKIGERGYAFVIDEKGTYLTHPDIKKILKKNLLIPSQESLIRNKKVVSNILSERIKGSVIVYPEILNSEKSWAYFSPIPETSWYLVFIMPFHELYRDLYGVTLWMSFFALSGIVLIYFLISYITRRQIRPLSHITSKLSSFSSPFRLNTKNEVKQVANSLEYLKVWFEQYQIAREKEELSNFQHTRDLIQASEIQQSLIKTSFPAFPKRTDIDLHAIYKPAQTVSGDLFDYFFIDEHNLIFTIGDVSGKGIPAAIFMSVCQTVIKNNSHFRYPREIVRKTNFELCISNRHQYFLTLFLGVLNLQTGVLSFCNAAHTFPFILKPDGRLVENQSIHGLPLGLYPEKTYEDEQILLEANDTIILYTDGVYDALNEKNIPSGSIWFQRNLSKMGKFSPAEITSTLEKELSNAESTHKDDICLLAIKYTP